MELITLFDNIKTSPIKWLWFPYIAVGKITLIQGNPGDGKSIMLMNLIAEISKGGTAPDGQSFGTPGRVIYQCAEDVSDTIKPGLEAAGADCGNIAFINEEIHKGITLDDERLRKAITDFRPKLMVIDPVQAYWGNEINNMSTGCTYKIMRKLGLWASTYDCSIVIVSYDYKKLGSKGKNRSFEGTDIIASARSVLSIECDVKDREVRIIKHIKNSIGPIGKDLFFRISEKNGFSWEIDENIEYELKKEYYSRLPKNKHELCAILLKRILCNGEVESKEIYSQIAGYNIGSKTLQEVKSDLGIESVRRMRKWYWRLPLQKI